MPAADEVHRENNSIPNIRPIWMGLAKLSFLLDGVCIVMHAQHSSYLDGVGQAFVLIGWGLYLNACPTFDRNACPTFDAYYASVLERRLLLTLRSAIDNMCLSFPAGGENSSQHSNATTPAALHHEHLPCPDVMHHLVPALLSEFEEADEYSLLNKCSTNDMVSFRILQETAKMQNYRRKHESRAIRAIPVPQQGRSACTSTPSPLLLRGLLPQMHRRLTSFPSPPAV